MTQAVSGDAVYSPACAVPNSRCTSYEGAGGVDRMALGQGLSAPPATIPVTRGNTLTIITVATVLNLSIAIAAVWYATRARREATTCRYATDRAIQLGYAAECHADEIAKDTSERIRQWRRVLQLHIDNDARWSRELADLMRRIMDSAYDADTALLRGLQETQMRVDAVQTTQAWERGGH